MEMPSPNISLIVASVDDATVTMAFDNSAAAAVESPETESTCGTKMEEEAITIMTE